METEITVTPIPVGQDRSINSDSHNNASSAGSLTPTMIDIQLKLIPERINKIDLANRLMPVLNQLSRMEKVKTEAYLEKIKKRFNLKGRDIDAYRDLVYKEMRKDRQVAREKEIKLNLKINYTASFDGLVDLVDDQGKSAFLVKDESGLSVVSEYKKDGIVYSPPAIEQIPWLLPRAEEIKIIYELNKNIPDSEFNAKLFGDLAAYHQSVSELPSEAYYELLAVWVMHTYLLESFFYSPIICLFAVPERGKSRTGKSIIYVSYRGIYVESLREAYLIRVAHNFSAALFFDVRDIWKKAEKFGTEDILLLRFEKGAKVPRVLYPEKGAYEDTVYYYVFGPTVMATNKAVDEILETRAVSITMPESDKRFENDIRPEFCLDLKERLLVFRARNLGKVLPEANKPARGRLGDIMKPLLQIVLLVKPEKEFSFRVLVEELCRNRLANKADTLEAQIILKVWELRNELTHSKIPVKDITEAVNLERSQREQLTYQLVGRRLKALGFSNSKTDSGNSAVIYDEKLVEKLKDKYGLIITPEIPETSVTPDAAIVDTGVSDDTGVCF